MKQIYTIHLFNKNILVNDTKKTSNNVFELAYSFAHHLGIKLVEGSNLATIDVFKFASDQLGYYIPSPFYKGFPNSVQRILSTPC